MHARWSQKGSKSNYVQLHCGLAVKPIAISSIMVNSTLNAKDLICEGKLLLKDINKIRISNSFNPILCQGKWIGQTKLLLYSTNKYLLSDSTNGKWVSTLHESTLRVWQRNPTWATQPQGPRRVSQLAPGLSHHPSFRGQSSNLANHQH